MTFILNKLFIFIWQKKNLNNDNMKAQPDNLIDTNVSHKKFNFLN